MFKDLIFYKANAKNSGCAVKLSLSTKPSKDRENQTDTLLFMEFSPQSQEKDEAGNARFDWKNRVVMKLDQPDIGEMLAVLNGWQEKAGYKGSIYHEDKDGNTKILNFEKTTFNDVQYLSVKISANNKQAGTTVRMQQLVSLGEAATLKVFLEDSLRKLYNL